MDYSSKLLLTCTFLLILIDQTISIKCYFCTVLPPNRYENTTERLCSKFDESSKFIQDCPFSTMCVKRVYKYQLMGGEEQETISRGCAQQKHTDQVYEKGKWEKKAIIEEPYEEGCAKAADGSTYCHCRGAFCNSATKADNPIGYHTDAMAVIFVFNIMKYIRNMDY